MPRPKKGQEHPRPELANQIGLLVAIGTTQEQIARMLKMSKETLHKHYTDDLDLGSAKAGAVVGGKIFEAAKRGEAWACTLWAARRMGWKEQSQVDLSGSLNITGAKDDLAKRIAGTLAAKPATGNDKSDS